MKAPELSNIVLRKDKPISLLIRLLFGVSHFADQVKKLYENGNVLNILKWILTPT